MNATISVTLADELKQSTAEAHTRVERHPVNHALLTGELNKAGYAAYLVQWLGIHTAVEGVLVRLRRLHPAFSAMVKDYHFRLPALAADLTALGRPLGTRESYGEQVFRFAQRVHQLQHDQPLSVLGFLYVLEGSTNGGKFLADAVVRAYGSEVESATHYLNPHGRLQRERWSEFRTGLNALELLESERAQVLEGALEMFAWVGRVFDDLGGQSTESNGRLACPHASGALAS